MDTTNGQQLEDTGVGVNVDAILAGYADALSSETQRRIMAEATVAALTAERASLRAQLAELQQPCQNTTAKDKGTKA